MLSEAVTVIEETASEVDVDGMVKVVTVGAWVSATEFAVYVRVVGLVSDGLLVGVRVIDPAVVGVMANVWAVLELEKVRVIADIPELPAPVGVMVIVPVYEELGVMVKLVDALPTLPLDGPVKV